MASEQLALLLSSRNTSHLARSLVHLETKLSSLALQPLFHFSSLSLHPPFHSALSFNGQSDAEEDQHQGVGQESNGEGTSNQLPTDGGKDGSDDSTKESQVEELLHSAGDTKVHKTGPTMLSIQQLFHANTKISTISSQDGWLLFDELDHIRFDAKTRGPSTVRQGQEPRFYRETSRIKFTF